MTSGDGRVITYSSFDKPTLIVQGVNSAAFTYGPDRARFKRVDTTTAGVKTTYYAAGGSYERILSGTTVAIRHYIGDFAVVIDTHDGTNVTQTTDYLHRDHLGSVDTITDSTGAIAQKMSFDTSKRSLASPRRASAAKSTGSR